jgi:hypothetical protein
MPELEEVVSRQNKQIKELKQIIEDLKNDSTSVRHSPSAGSQE